MLVLGIHNSSPMHDSDDMDPGWAYHDAAAVLVEDGRVLAAIEEERLNRVKRGRGANVRGDAARVPGQRPS
jgi:carbamoyltransferase